MTEYILQALTSKNGILYSLETKNKKEALEQYSKLCETCPKDKFRLIKRITTEETIAESEDIRQASFDFV